MDNKTYKCYRCPFRGDEENVKECCCDCSVRLCLDCRNDYDVKCGCYGECNFCGKDVNRGDNGWPCSKCDKWLCSKCLNNNKCEECNNVTLN